MPCVEVPPEGPLPDELKRDLHRQELLVDLHLFNGAVASGELRQIASGLDVPLDRDGRDPSALDLIDRRERSAHLAAHL